QLLPVMVTGASLVVAPRFSTSRYWEWVRAFDVTVGSLLAGPIRFLLAQPASAPDRQHRLRIMGYGLPLLEQEIPAFHQRFAGPRTMGWGLTETLNCGTSMPLYLGRRPGWQCIGRPLLGVEVAVVDDDGNRLPPGELGELTVRSPAVMRGYYGDPE